jgi:hypothetical protein
MAERIYAIHSDEECERLEAQAQLVPLSFHLKPYRSSLAHPFWTRAVDREACPAKSRKLSRTRPLWASTCGNPISILLVVRPHLKI